MGHYKKTKPKSSRYRGRKKSAQSLRKYFDQHQRIFPNLNKDMPIKSTRNVKNTKYIEMCCRCSETSCQSRQLHPEKILVIINEEDKTFQD